MTLLCLCWGLNQVAIKFALPEVPPFTQALIRTGGGLVIVLAWVLIRGMTLIKRDGTLWAGIAAGILFATEFLMIFAGLQFTSASRASLFIYTAPFVVAAAGAARRATRSDAVVRACALLRRPRAGHRRSAGEC